MNDELDFDDYPTLHLHMMIDDYEELCMEANRRSRQENVNEIPNDGRDGYKHNLDLQGRFSFCFTG